MIARYGGDWFRELGTDLSPGTTLMTLCGNVRRPGVYEVNTAGTAGEVLAAAGGSPTPAAGALVGGYFGTWVRAGALERLPLDRGLGCGVLALLPQNGCGLVEAARIVTYLAWESSGQCGPCVNGLAALSVAMERIAHSAPQAEDHERVMRWLDMVRGRGACHHPDGAAGQLASALTAFPEHLHMHLIGRRCPGLDAKGFPRPPAAGSGWK
jgi:NADH:ubiquinone oxidoreductase subunit F (NADH-binding)